MYNTKQNTLSSDTKTRTNRTGIFAYINLKFKL